MSLRPPVCTFAVIAVLSYSAFASAQDDPVAVTLSGGQRVSSHGILVWGTLPKPPQTQEDAPSYRGLLLFSSDEGRSWNEALPLLENSEVMGVTPAAGGWMLVVGWTLEGPGPLTLLKSDDGGRSFRELGPIPKRDNLDSFAAFKFESAARGCVRLANSDETATYSLGTQDGGHHWRRAIAKSCSAPTVRAVPAKTTVDGFSLNLGGDAPLTLPTNWIHEGQRWRPVTP